MAASGGAERIGDSPREREKDTGSTTETETRDVTSDMGQGEAGSRRHNGGTGREGKAKANATSGAAEAVIVAEAGRTEMTKTPMIVKPGDVTSNEWEQRRSKASLNTWDFRRAATTKQTKWHTSTAASSSEYGIVVEEMNDTGRARASIETTGGNKNALRGDLRVVPDNMTTVQKIDQGAEAENEQHTVEHLIERVGKLEEHSKEMQQRIQRMEYNDFTTDSTGHGASSKRKHDDNEGSFGWCRWRGSWWIRIDQGLNSRQRRTVSRSLQRLVAREKEGINTSNTMSGDHDEKCKQRTCATIRVDH